MVRVQLLESEASEIGMTTEAAAMQAVRSALGLTGNGGKYRSVFRSHEMWRLLAARSGVLSPGLVKRAKAWGGQI